MAGELNIVVLFSGEGTNLENLIEQFHNIRFGEKVTKIVPITNRPDAGGIRRAERYGIDTIVIDHKRYERRESFDADLVKAIEKFDPSLVVMAGFMRILTPVFTENVEAINLHPSLLPLFKGAHAIEESFSSGMKVGGVTVHRVTPELDNGEILDQACVKIEPGETLETFADKIHQAEYRLLPEVIRRLLNL
ncbi:phosphoribosylglycinamide formyltransferase [Hydrogenimonas cancrithermarum]|uniref:Phosphoribosylglycinamide formyltransferase n=1 Tax=Hydrogenimonas cancrithermarum TaxID=2993563 RepID=A0ABM8FLM1_9BACT|nr:phosphoribosylglycinamide formyltransferase [Hydrogenimonas cancrithermarum]BDY13193.1 phosphoribosylglycinamide formyltransferase [Hydrogenimonas cancrithermarum]